MIPGSEYAPIYALDPSGIRPATAKEVEYWETAKITSEEDHGSSFEPMVMVGEAVVWRLSVLRSDEQRIIWRAAARLLTPNDAEPDLSVMLRVERDWWVLRPATFHRASGYFARVHAHDMAHATAVLCAHVWGPK